VKSRVAIVRSTPEKVLPDIARVMDLGLMREALDPSATTILKDNISWHFPYPGANTTPWQLDGAVLALKAAGLGDLVCVQNDTVVTSPKKGERLNGYLDVLSRHGVPIRYNCFPEDLRWVEYRPKGEMLALGKVFPDGIRIPEGSTRRTATRLLVILELLS
jgi:hypothetical protein